MQKCNSAISDLSQLNEKVRVAFRHLYCVFAFAAAMPLGVRESSGINYIAHLDRRSMCVCAYCDFHNPRDSFCVEATV